LLSPTPAHKEDSSWLFGEGGELEEDTAARPFGPRLLSRPSSAPPATNVACSRRSPDTEEAEEDHQELQVASHEARPAGAVPGARPSPSAAAAGYCLAGAALEEEAAAADMALEGEAPRPESHEDAVAVGAAAGSADDVAAPVQESQVRTGLGCSSPSRASRRSRSEDAPALSARQQAQAEDDEDNDDCHDEEGGASRRDEEENNDCHQEEGETSPRHKVVGIGGTQLNHEDSEAEDGGAASYQDDTFERRSLKVEVEVEVAVALAEPRRTSLDQDMTPSATTPALRKMTFWKVAWKRMLMGIGYLRWRRPWQAQLQGTQTRRIRRKWKRRCRQMWIMERW